MQLENLFKDVKAQAGLGTIVMVCGLAVGILVLAIIFTMGPVVGYNVENSVSVPATSGWSSVGNTAIVNGSELWVQNTPLLSSTSIVVIAGVIISVLLGAFIFFRGRQ